jgi:hypothetical protein
MEESNLEFRKLASVLSGVTFSEPLGPNEQVGVRMLDWQGRGRRVYKAKGNLFRVDHYAGGCARYWARPASAEVACRLADMITLRLHSKSLRANKPLTDDDFNVSLKRAKSDCESEGGIVSLLVQMECALPEPKPAGRPKGRKNQTLRSEVLHVFDTITYRLNDILSQSDSAEKQLSALTKVLADVVARLERLEQKPVIVLPPAYVPPCPAPPTLVPMTPLPYEVTCGAFNPTV